MGGHIAHHTPCKSSNSAIDYAGPLHLKDQDAKMDKARDENGRIRFEEQAIGSGLGYAALSIVQLQCLIP